jgi:PAS domain S-box-containing protein
MSRTESVVPSKTSPAAQAPTPDLATFFLVSLDLLCIRDSAFRFVRVNEAWQTLLGYTAEELEGRPMLDFIHPDDHPASHGHMQRLVVEDEVRGYVNRYRGRDGTYHHLEWRARRVGDLVYGVARDVTDQVALEREKAEAMAAAHAANRAKSDFLANMSHEIRTPLNGVIGVAGALAQTRLEPEQQEMIDLIIRSGETLERLVSDILDLSKIEAGRLELETREFDLLRELEPMLGIFRLRAEEKGLNFSTQLGTRARGTFLGDSVRLRQLLANLLSNAVKFTTEGAVSVKAVFDEGALGEPGWFTIEVRDTGVGFDKVAAERLFQRFSQADGSITRKFGGTGLGLSICQALAEMMGGRISAASSPGRGATFKVQLPLMRTADLAAYDRSGGPRAPTNRTADLDLGDLTGCRILLAEDHPINRRVVELILSPFGVAITVAEDGAEAVRAYETESFDLILMDMQMPNMDGLAATREIRAIEARRSAAAGRTPIIMLSANAMRHHAEEALAAGADLHLAKPVTAERLLAALAQTLGQEPEPMGAAPSTARLS